MATTQKKQPTIDDQISTLMDKFDDVNTFFIHKVAEQILKIGEMNQSSINRVTIMAEMNSNMAQITARLAKAIRVGLQDMQRIYQKALNDTYTDPRFARALTNAPLSDAAKDRLEQYTRSVSLQTAGTMQNLSNTTAISDMYRQTVDRAVLAVSSGLGDYKSATRDSIRRLGYNGMPVIYASGKHKRLDSAIRQNIIDGTNQIAQRGSDIMGEELGFDAFEISAHARSAPDHEPVQGRVFLKAEFEKMQAGLPFQDVDGKQYEGFRRPIGQWNCMHLAMSFSTQHSVRRYTDAQLAQWASDNAKGCEIDGKHYTTYKAVQLMRQIETQVRREKDVAVAAQAADDDVLRMECQERINKLSRKYTQVAQTAGITPRRDRMSVNGFKAVKVK
ncbi:MAG: phage minor capsid protein [Clostridiales bacterium]|nr:phage minor capsid protein [Clostridiales bacterium]